jgi:glycerol-3-phosphate dehydrogenase (NAD(P)+)
MNIGYLGFGAWGYCLAYLLASKGYHVTSWSIDTPVVESFNKEQIHPLFPTIKAPTTLRATTHLTEALTGADLIIEGVTASAVRPVLEKIKALKRPLQPICLTSKGIEQNTSLLLSEVAIDVLGEDATPFIGCLSGPSHAEEVIKGLPTTVVSSAYTEETMKLIQGAFTTPSFRVYPNSDINGVEFGGAMKNIIAIACGISDGLAFGDNAKAALMTRGLHEISKLAITKGANKKTLSGLSGMGDLCVTCLSNHSRNYRFGRLIAEGLSLTEAKAEIKQVVEGSYACVSALQLSQKSNIAVPIIECVYNILYNNLKPSAAVKTLMQRTIKEELS